MQETVCLIWNFHLPGVDSTSNRNVYQLYLLGAVELLRADNFTTFMCELSRNSGSLNLLQPWRLEMKVDVQYDVNFLLLVPTSETSLNSRIAFYSSEFLQNKWTCFTHQVVLCIGCWEVLSPTRKETSSEACHGRARFQQHRDASCLQVFFFFPPARQRAEGNSRHSDRNISLFPSWLV